MNTKDDAKGESEPRTLIVDLELRGLDRLLAQHTLFMLLDFLSWGAVKPPFTAGFKWIRCGMGQILGHIRPLALAIFLALTMKPGCPSPLFLLTLFFVDASSWTESEAPVLIPLAAKSTVIGEKDNTLEGVEDPMDCFEGFREHWYKRYWVFFEGKASNPPIAFSFDKSKKTCTSYKEIHHLLPAEGVDTFLIQKMNCPEKKDIRDDVKALFNQLVTCPPEWEERRHENGNVYCYMIIRVRP
ncbi:hypothetical protein QR680_019143 [Steinernema hermaphroditum]|uniref:Uncharacterized protein n=1 Tax=Steinernema hermaphroditum TaxID=289476 RepID=A0AA39HL33_9BILA|nr:hypothetical protein QR680_019143 [Steinernema hermaphroditum]